MALGLIRPTRPTTGARATGRMAAQFWARAWHSAQAMRLGAGPAAEVIGAVTPTSTGITTTSTSIGQALAAVGLGTTGPSTGRASVTTTKASPTEWAGATRTAAVQV